MRIILPLFLLFIGANMSVDYYLYRRVLKKLSLTTWAKALYWGAHVLIQLLLAVILYANFNKENRVLPEMVIMWGLWGYFTLYIPKFGYALLSFFDYIPLLFKQKRSHIGGYIGGTLATFVALTMMVGAFWGSTHLIVNEVKVSIPSLPAAFEGYRIVHISDIHLRGHKSDERLMTRLVERINTLDADLVVFTGDLVNREGYELTPELATILSSVEATHGVYSILGNHDYGDYAYWQTPEQQSDALVYLLNTQNAMGWRMLNNAHRVLHLGQDSLVLIGVEDWGEPPFNQFGDLAASYPSLNDSTTKILLTHNPKHWELVVRETSNIALTLAGHTHAMQMKLPIGKRGVSPSSLVYTYWSGLYTEGEQHLYVNDGIGYVLYPMRAGNAFPEITLLQLDN